MQLMRSVLFVVAVGILFSARADDGEYVSQTYVDTTIARALYLLTAAADQAEIGLTMEGAILQAKEIARKLRDVAENDVNKSYILFKVQELESQIYLEEEGIYQEKLVDRQRSVNDLVTKYNRELGKDRPDFSALKAIVEKTSEYDSNTFDEMARGYRDRRNAIAGEVLHAIEAAIDDEMYDVARAELAYCRENRSFLGIRLTQYAKLEGRLQARVSTDGELAFIDQTADQIDSLLPGLELGKAGQKLDLINRRLSVIETRVPKRHWDLRYFRSKRQAQALASKEDSLINQTRKILQTDGVYAAGQHLEILKKYGVSHDKIAQINQQITSVALAQRDETPGKLGAELALLTSDDDGGTEDLLGDLRSAAKQKAGGSPFPVRTGERVSRMEQVRRRNLEVSKELALEREERRRRENRERAQREVMLVYTLLEQGEIAEAFEQFEFVMKNLKDYLSAEDVESLGKSVEKKTK